MTPTSDADLAFVIPTYRLRDVGETVELYDENFWRNGHASGITVFDDSNPGLHEKYYPLLEETKTFNDLYYVGPREKEEFLRFLSRRLKDRKLDLIVRNLFRPSYGGNRNFTLIYTLGQLVVSSDDDMRPYALVEDSPESLGDGEVCRGRLAKVGENGFTRRSFDILSSFREVLGKPAGELPPNYEHGNGPGDECEHRHPAGELPAAGSRPGAALGPGQGGPDLSVRHQRHRRDRLSRFVLGRRATGADR
jgi:hypothetical protein